MTGAKLFTTIASQLQPPTTIFENIGEPLLNTKMKAVLMGVDGSFWNLAGNYEGREGLTLAPKLSGYMHAPFTSIFSEGPYSIGAYYERTDYKKRMINLAVMVGNDYAPMDSWKYRRLEQKWWRAWSPSKPATLCCYTRSHGWRFLKVLLAEEPKTPLELDPTAFDNHFMQWDIVIVACQPFWAKKVQVASWKNTPDTSTLWSDIIVMLEELINQFLGDVLIGKGGYLVPGLHIGEGNIAIWNNSDFEMWPKFLVSAPGRAWIEDGPGGRMVPLPVLTDKDGTCLVDTDPTGRTLTCATDPIDPLFFQILSNIDLFDVLFHDVVVSHEPVWKREEVHFTTPTPPRTLANIKVYHSDPTGSVTAFMPQHFDMAYG